MQLYSVSFCVERASQFKMDDTYVLKVVYSFDCIKVLYCYIAINILIACYLQKSSDFKWCETMYQITELFQISPTETACFQ